MIPGPGSQGSRAGSLRPAGRAGASRPRRPESPRLALLAALVLAGALVGACAARADDVSGTIVPDRAVPADNGARIELELVDTTRADHPLVLVRMEMVSASRPPYGFNLPYDPRALQAGHSYGVAVRVAIDGRPTFATAHPWPVTPGAGAAPLRVVVHAISAASLEAIHHDVDVTMLPAAPPAAAPVQATPAPAPATADGATAPPIAPPAPEPAQENVASLAATILPASGTSSAGGSGATAAIDPAAADAMPPLPKVKPFAPVAAADAHDRTGHATTDTRTLTSQALETMAAASRADVLPGATDSSGGTGNSGASGNSGGQAQAPAPGELPIQALTQILGGGDGGGGGGAAETGAAAPSAPAVPHQAVLHGATTTKTADIRWQASFDAAMHLVAVDERDDHEDGRRELRHMVYDGAQLTAYHEVDISAPDANGMTQSHTLDLVDHGGTVVASAQNIAGDQTTPGEARVADVLARADVARKRALAALAGAVVSDHGTTTAYACDMGQSLVVSVVDDGAWVEVDDRPPVLLRRATTSGGFLYGDASHELRGEGELAIWNVAPWTAPSRCGPSRQTAVLELPPVKLPKPKPDGLARTWVVGFVAHQVEARRCLAARGAAGALVTGFDESKDDTVALTARDPDGARWRCTVSQDKTHLEDLGPAAKRPQLVVAVPPARPVDGSCYGRVRLDNAAGRLLGILSVETCGG